MINFHGFRRTDADSSAVLPTLSLFAERFPNYQKRYLLALVTVIVVTMWGFFLDTFLWDSPPSDRFTLASTEFPDIKRGSGWSYQIKFFPQAACVQANLLQFPVPRHVPTSGTPDQRVPCVTFKYAVNILVFISYEPQITSKMEFRFLVLWTTLSILFLLTPYTKGQSITSKWTCF